MNELNATESIRSAITGANRQRTDTTPGPVPAAASGVRSAGRSLPESAAAEPVQVSAEDRYQAIKAKVELAAASLNDYARSTQRELHFTVDSELGRPIVHVIDLSTQEVIRQIPSDVVLKLARNLQATLEQLDLQRPVLRAGQFVGADAHLGLVNTHI
jgi:flagellar protein FlaG